MAVKALTTGEMITISEPWVTKGTAQYKALAAIAELVPVLKKVEEAHKALLATQPPQPSARVATITLQLAESDTRHDQLTRAIDAVMTGFTLTAQDADHAAQLVSLHDKLLPDGLALIQKSYREEAGAGRLLQKRLDDADRAALKKLVLPGSRSVLGLVEDWIDSALTLGKLEDARAAEQGVPAGMTSGDLIRARNAWIRAVNALRSMAELHEVDDATTQLVFNALWAAERAASRRKARKTGDTQPSSPSAPGETAPAAPPAS